MGDKNWVIHFGSGVLQTGSDVLGLQIRIIFQDLHFGDISCQQIEHILHTDAQPPDAGATSTLIRIKSDALDHAGRVIPLYPMAKDVGKMR
jgi:hypothetical protein